MSGKVYTCDDAAADIARITSNIKATLESPDLAERDPVLQAIFVVVTALDAAIDRGSTRELADSCLRFLNEKASREVGWN